MLLPLLLRLQSSTRHGTYLLLYALLSRVPRKKKPISLPPIPHHHLPPLGLYGIIQVPTPTVEQATNVKRRRRQRDTKRTRISLLSGCLQRQSSSQQILSPSGCSSHTVAYHTVPHSSGSYRKATDQFKRKTTPSPYSTYTYTVVLTVRLLLSSRGHRTTSTVVFS